jgi:hypothetical protein
MNQALYAHMNNKRKKKNGNASKEHSTSQGMGPPHPPAKTTYNRRPSQMTVMLSSKGVVLR